MSQGCAPRHGRGAVVREGVKPGQPMTASNYSILVVDQSPAFRIIQKWFFGSLGHAVAAVPDTEQALLWLANHPCHVLLAEARLPVTGFKSLAQETRALFPSVKVVLRTGEPPAAGMPFDLAVEQSTHLMGLCAALDRLMRTASPAAELPVGLAAPMPAEPPAASPPEPRVPIVNPDVPSGDSGFRCIG